MEKEHPGRKHIDPRLLSLIDASEEISWLFIKNLKRDDVVEVQTIHTLYTMKVVDPEKGQVLVTSNGKKITKEVNGTVCGSSLTGTGTMMKMGGIAVGLRLVLFAQGMGELLLSFTQKVSVNGFEVLPGQSELVH